VIVSRTTLFVVISTFGRGSWPRAFDGLDGAAALLFLRHVEVGGGVHQDAALAGEVAEETADSGDRLRLAPEAQRAAVGAAIVEEPALVAFEDRTRDLRRSQ
jgi:hypothetical protein